MLYAGNHHFWAQLLDPLRRIGRDDLANAIAALLVEYRRCTARQAAGSWRQRTRRFDERVFGGALTSIVRRTRRTRAAPPAVIRESLP